MKKTLTSLALLALTGGLMVACQMQDKGHKDDEKQNGTEKQENGMDNHSDSMNGKMNDKMHDK